MARFQLIVSLREFTGDPRVGVKVSITTSPKRYPVAGVGVLETADTVETNEQGVAEFDLISLPGLVYLVDTGTGGAVAISGERADAAVVRLDSDISPIPSPIQPIDAAALRAEFLALVEGLEEGAVGPAGPQGPAGANGAAGSQGIQGPAGESVDNNLIVVNGGTVELDDDALRGALVSYEVTASTTFTSPSGTTILEPGVYSIRRTAAGWWVHPITGGAPITTETPVPELEGALLADSPVYLFMLDDAPGTTKPANIGSGTINTSDELVVGGITFGVASIGGVGTCAQFDGTGYIRTGIPFDDAASKSEYTIEFLMESTAGTRVVYDGPSQTNVTLFANGAVNAYVGGVGGAGAATFGAPVMMAAVCLGGRTKLYRNGVEVGDIGGWAPLGSGPTRSAMIGGYSGHPTLASSPEYGDDKFVGKLAALAIYHAAVSPERLTAHAVAAGVA